MPESATPPTWRLPPDGLPLSAFEEYMLLDDRPSHPMVIVARFDFIDDAPPANMAEAFQATLSQEPLLTARVDSTRRGRPRWLPASAPHLRHSTPPGYLVGETEWTGILPRLDPATGPMIHAELIEHSSGWSIVIAVHHAASDGLGVVGFVDRWLTAAEGKTARRTRREADAMAALGARARVAQTWTDLARMIPQLTKGLEGIGQFVTRRVARLDRHRGDSSCRSAHRDHVQHAWLPRIVSVTLDQDDIAKVECSAATAGVMVNDLLVAAMMATLGDIVATTDAIVTSSDWIRVGVPMSLRSKSDFVLPAANRVSMVFLDRKPHERHDLLALARSIRFEMDLIRSHALGHIFPLTLEASRLLPGGLARTAKRPQPQCTAVLSNLGRCFLRSPLADANGCIRVGGSRLANWWMVPPTRPGTALAAATHETASRRTIAFQVDPTWIPASTATAWLKQLRDTVLAQTPACDVPIGTIVEAETR